MNKKRIAFHTLGCKLNFAETSGLSRDLETDYQIVDFTDSADYFVVHSCSVTAMAEKKCRSYIRQAHQRNPEADIIVIGCMAQLRSEQLSKIEGVKLVLGNSEKFSLKEYLQNNSVKQNDHINVSNILKNRGFYPSFSGSDRTRTFVKIQDGCDYFCSYCTIPFARGRSRSNTISETMVQIRAAMENDPKEVVLTGVNIGDFGKGNNETLFALLQEIEKSDFNIRFRLSSIEPDLLTDPIIDLVAGSKIFMPHFHIPLQSGSDRVLKLMKRHYDSELFINRVNLIKNKLPHACIAADVITGFPGENEEEYEETFSLITQLPISYLHVFPFSERPGTLASGFPDKIIPGIIRARVDKLLELGEIKKTTFLKGNFGRIEKVLFESEDNNGFMSGFTSNYIRVRTPYRKDLVNKIVEIRLDTLDKENVYCYSPL